MTLRNLFCASYGLRPGWVIGVCTLLVLAFAADLVYLSVRDERTWETFALAHQCRVVERVAPTTAPTASVDSKGNPSVGTIYVPSKTAYLCDDGVTYWR